MTTYTAALLANTRRRAGTRRTSELPFLFAGSAMAAGGGVTMALSPVAEAGPSRKVAVAGAVIELAAAHKIENGHGIVERAVPRGPAGHAAARRPRHAPRRAPRLTVVAGRPRWGRLRQERFSRPARC